MGREHAPPRFVELKLSQDMSGQNISAQKTRRQLRQIRRTSLRENFRIVRCLVFGTEIGHFRMQRSDLPFALETSETLSLGLIFEVWIMPGMERILLFCIVVLLAGYLGLPLLAGESSASAPSPTPDEADQKAAIAVDVDVESALEDLVSKIDHDSTRNLLGRILPVLKIEIFGFSVGHLALSFAILLCGLVFRNLLAALVVRRLVQWAERSERVDVRLVHALTKPISALLMIIAVYLALLVLPLSDEVDAFLGNLFRGLTMLTLVWAAIMMADVLADFLEVRLVSQPGSALSGFAPLVKKSLKIFVLIIGILMTVDNLGYNVTGIIATLGLGTAAVALASQDTIRNAFGAMMIALDRPFRVGDWIQVGDQVDGNVESIGLRSTKVRTFPKTIVSIPNGVLANEYINNWSQMPKRRVRQVVGITYEATGEDMRNLVEDFRKILREDADIQQDFILVNFTDFGDSSLDILVYYFTTSVARLEHMDIRQRINCKIMDAIQKRGLSIAFPTRSLYLDGPAASKLAGIPYESRWDFPQEFAGGRPHGPA